jgi:hypothetical protein
VDVLRALLGADESGMCGVHEKIGMPLLGDVTVEVSGVEQYGELAPAVLPIGAGVLVDLIEAGKLGIAWRALVRVARLVGDAHDVALLRGLLHQWEKVACQHHVAHVVYGHVPVDAIVCEVGAHDSASAVVDEDVNTVGVVLDCLGHLFGSSPVTQVALHPLDAIGLVLSELIGDNGFCTVHDVFGGG